MKLNNYIEQRISSISVDELRKEIIKKDIKNNGVLWFNLLKIK